jgi:hypothetical protein
VSDRRARLAAREAELVRALHGGPVPAGLDEKMIGLTRDALARKRARQVARAFPALARDLGSEYQAQFVAFAETNPPQNEGGLADGLAFGAYAARRWRLSDDSRVELMIAGSRLNGRLEPRRGPYLAATATRRPAGVIIVARLPGLGIRVSSLYVPWGGTPRRRRGTTVK